MAEAKKKATKDILAAPRGMRDVMGDEYYALQGFFEKAQEIAEYYGFKPIKTPVVEHAEIFEKGAGAGSDIVEKEMYTFKTKGRDYLAMRPEGTAAVMRSYIEHGMKSLPQPVMFYYFEPMFRHEKPQRGRYRQHHQFGLEVLGTPKSIADALIIKTTLTILEASGAKNLFVDVNSIGDKESRADYLKELKAYYRKHINQLAPIDRERLKTNPLRVLDSKEEKTIEVNEGAPDSVSSLSNSSKKHFKELLEYLEEMGVSYRINKSLVRGLDYYSETVFEVMEEAADEKSKPLAICGGGRYDYLASTIGHKKEIPGVGVGIGAERVTGAEWWGGLDPRNIKKPSLYFIQLGFDAKLKSLNIVEMLRKAGIPIAQALSKDSLSGQLGTAEKMGVKAVLIFGQKEANDGTIIVRNMEKRSQDSVPIEELVAYLRKKKLK